MISTQLSEVGNARFGIRALRNDAIALLTVDAYLLPEEKCAPVAAWRSWQGAQQPDAALLLAAMSGSMGVRRHGEPAAAEGSKRIDAVQGVHIADVHVTDTTTFPTSLGPPPSCLPV